MNHDKTPKTEPEPEDDEMGNDSAVKPKDAWDIAGTLSQIASGTIIGIVGLLITYKLGEAAGAQSQATLDATNRQISSQFLTQLTRGTGLQRAGLLDTIDIAMPDNVAAHMAVRFAGPVTQTIDFPFPQYDETSKQMETEGDARKGIEAAWNALNRIKVKENLERDEKAKHSSNVEPTSLENIRNSGVIPDADIAGEFTGNEVVPFMRINDIDDQVMVFVNDAPVLREFIYGDDSDWVALKPFLSSKENNNIDLYVRNDSGPAGVRLALRLGKEQYDKAIRCENCAQNADVIRFHSNIRAKDGLYHLNGQDLHHCIGNGTKDAFEKLRLGGLHPFAHSINQLKPLSADELNEICKWDKKPPLPQRQPGAPASRR